MVHLKGRGTFQRVELGGFNIRLRAIRSTIGLSVMPATPALRVRDIGTGGACRLAMVSRLSVQGLRNGHDAHRMAETRSAARTQPDSLVGEGAGRPVAAYCSIGINQRRDGTDTTGQNFQVKN